MRWLHLPAECKAMAELMELDPSGVEKFLPRCARRTSARPPARARKSPNRARAEAQTLQDAVRIRAHLGAAGASGIYVYTGHTTDGRTVI